jgi:hypothetical protein
MSERYTTWGPVRGDCGHAHTMPMAAERCIERDRAGCEYQGGYSDRHVRVISDESELASYDTTRGPGVVLED